MQSSYKITQNKNHKNVLSYFHTAGEPFFSIEGVVHDSFNFHN